MARKYKSRVTSDKLDIKIELQKEALEKAKAKYEAEKETLAELIKMRNEFRKEELMDAVINSDKNDIATTGIMEKMFAGITEEQLRITIETLTLIDKNMNEIGVN